MKRAVSLLLLLVLALPYARTPICDGSGHEHGDHAPVTATFDAPDHHGGDSSDCHRLMACDTVIQGLIAAAEPGYGIEPPLVDGDRRASIGRDDPTRTPIPPPPQSV